MGLTSTRAEEISRSATEALGRGTNHRLALSEQEDEQGLRALMRDEPDHDLCGYEPLNVEEAHPCLTFSHSL